MKKIVVLLLTLVFAFALTSCSDGEKPSDSGQTDDLEHLLSESYANTMNSGKFLLRYQGTFTSEGETFDAEVTTATDGKSVSTIIKTDMMTTHTLVKDGATYILNDQDKTYSKMDLPQAGDQLLDTAGMEYVGKGSESIDGKELVYEEYTVSDGTLRYYFEEKALYAISTKTDDGEMLMKVLELSDQVTDSMLSLPSDYSEVSAMSNTGAVNLSEDMQKELEELQDEYGDVDPEALQKQTEDALRAAGVDPDNIPAEYSE